MSLSYRKYAPTKGTEISTTFAQLVEISVPLVEVYLTIRASPLPPAARKGVKICHLCQCGKWKRRQSIVIEEITRWQERKASGGD